MKVLAIKYSRRNMKRVCKFLGIKESNFTYDRVMYSDKGNYNYRNQKYRVILHNFDNN